ncbi:MAG: class I SAM-dependent methyltransferase [Chloroflexi bacterium]|jgi:2-polyprenyl-3-methyl-5-hydroxy-6-metoxy-1,4-benzoquinol methylase|nr:class I SAM-dependent methyltransferase [Chloroflexota bacterium]
MAINNTSPRFKFGKNWGNFIRKLSAVQIQEAEQSLINALGVSSFAGKKFLDVGSGSGLFSLAAMRLNAERVHSFDYDSDSVACARELKRRYFPDDPRWMIEQGDALDTPYVESLGEWDIVYSWGVLHHTGDMYLALDNAAQLVKASGRLFIAIYNDQGRKSEAWTSIKKFYSKSPLIIQWLMASGYFLFLGSMAFIRDTLFLRPLATFRNYHSLRGMNFWTDVVDWIGGYPFEVASPEKIFEFYRQRGFVLTYLKTVQGKLGNNEFVFFKQD